MTDLFTSALTFKAQLGEYHPDVRDEAIATVDEIFDSSTNIDARTDATIRLFHTHIMHRAHGVRPLAPLLIKLLLPLLSESQVVDQYHLCAGITAAAACSQPTNRQWKKHNFPLFIATGRQFRSSSYGHMVLDLLKAEESRWRRLLDSDDVRVRLLMMQLLTILHINNNNVLQRLPQELYDARTPELRREIIEAIVVMLRVPIHRSEVSVETFEMLSWALLRDFDRETDPITRRLFGRLMIQFLRPPLPDDMLAVLLEDFAEAPLYSRIDLLFHVLSLTVDEIAQFLTHPAYSVSEVMRMLDRVRIMDFRRPYVGQPHSQYGKMGLWLPNATLQRDASKMVLRAIAISDQFWYPTPCRELRTVFGFAGNRADLIDMIERWPATVRGAPIGRLYRLSKAPR